jgi:transcriptional repressor NrdR
MKCPFCQSEDVHVIDTRKFDTVIIRIRRCNVCNAAFQTEEEIKLMTPIYLKVIIPSSSDLPK